MDNDDNESYVHTMRLPIGTMEVLYPKDVEILGVKLRGMRNRPVVLVRTSLVEMGKMSRTVRGLPVMYAVDPKKRWITVWPAPLQNYELLVELKPLEGVVTSPAVVGGDGG